MLDILRPIGHPGSLCLVSRVNRELPQYRPQANFTLFTSIENINGSGMTVRQAARVDPYGT